jgi:hypothetical protein
VEENRRRGKREPEFELGDTGVFDDDRYFDVFAEYAKAGPDDILIRIASRTAAGSGHAARAADALVPQHVVWGCRHEGCWIKPRIEAAGDAALRTDHVDARHVPLAAGPGPDGAGESPRGLFTENETNTAGSSAHSNLDALRQGRVPRIPDPRADRRGEPGPVGTKAPRSIAWTSRRAAR